MADIRVGYVGTGGNAQGHLKRLSDMDGVRVAACCDISLERAQASADKFGGQAFSDWRKMLDTAELDAVYHSLPPFAHEGAELAAVEAGLHIFVEKPVVTEMELGLKTKEAIDRKGVLSCVGYQLRYHPAVDALRDWIGDKAVGMAVSERWGGIAGGTDHWWRVMSKSGGMLHEQATHQLDLLRCFAGEVVEVHKKEGLRINTDQQNNTIPDCEVVLLEYASGAVGYITTTSALVNGGGGSRIELVVEGHIRIQFSGSDITVRPDGAATIPVTGEASFESIDHAFMEAIRQNDGSLVKSDYADGLRTCAITIAANRSAVEKKPIRVPQI